MNPPQNPPPAGWYPDPQYPGQQRYWNGQSWTEHRQQAVQAQPAPPAWPQQQTAGYQGSARQPSRAGKFVKWAAAIVVLIVIISIVANSGSNNGNNSGNLSLNSSSTSASSPA